MAEEREPPKTTVGWDADQLKAYVDERLHEVNRAVDVAREGEPPHVTLQYHLEAVLNEREKQVTLALDSADKLEQERIARASDRAAFERERADLVRALSDTAILKAEAAASKQFDDFYKTVNSQLADMRTAMQDLTKRVDLGLGGG
jgi:hypothetical protein